MTPSAWPALETACLRHRLAALGPAADAGPPPLGPAFARLLDLPAVAPRVQRAALCAEFRGEETPALRRRFVEWLLLRLPDADPPLLETLGPILSEIAGVELAIRPAAPWGEGGAGAWRTGRYEVTVATAPPTPPADAPPEAALRAADFAPELVAAFAAAPTAADKRDAFVRLLDDLAAKAGGLPPAAADLALAALRAAAEGVGVAVTPRGFTYSGECQCGELTPAEMDAATMNFDERRPAGRVVAVRQFGWEGAAGTGRPASVAISLGPPMDDVRECIRLGLATAPPDLEPLRAEIRRWRSRLLDGTFAESLRGFYADLYGPLGRPWRVVDEPGFVRFRDALHEVLRNRCGLRPFFPAHRNEYERHWMVLVGNAAPQTGRVRRVVQPGLLDAQQRLVFPAHVEVD